MLRRRNTELEQRTQSVEHQLSSISPTSVRGTMDNVTRDLFSECESTGASAWPFTLATKDAVMVATNSSPPRLNRLLGLHLSLGRQCRTMRNDTEMLKKVIEHMKTESQRRQKRQQEQINALKHRLTVQQQQLESSQTTQTQSYSPFASASSSLSSTTNSFKIPNTTANGRLPDAAQGAEHLRDVFHRMGFNDKEIVCLSGAHTLGRCHKTRSGFDGPWTTNPLQFDNYTSCNYRKN